MANLVIGQDYYYINATDFAGLEALVTNAGFQMTDFPWFKVDQEGYAGYYFELDQISDEEWEVLSQCPSFDTRAVWLSVQANYLG